MRSEKRSGAASFQNRVDASWPILYVKFTVPQTNFKPYRGIIFAGHFGRIGFRGSRFLLHPQT